MRALLFKSLDALTAADAGRAGGKAWNCARLKQHGFAVPDGLVIPADAATADLEAVAGDPWFDRWPAGERYAVRSSGLGEDAPEHSFAGIHETLLDVDRSGVREAVAACRASAHSERARAYRRALGLAEAGAAPAVLVQRMIHPVTAGVAFTVDPVTGASTIVVSAVAGLGVAVVDGTAATTDVRIEKTAAGADPLGALLVAIEQFFGAPQDVEWCFDGTQYWIVQSRPITSVANGGRDTEWTRANLVEVLPDLTSPQALHAIEEMLNVAQRRYMGGLIAPDHVLGPMVKPFYGRLYFNVTQLRRVCLLTGTPPARILRALGHAGTIHPEDERAPAPPLRARLACLPHLLRVVGRHVRVGPIVRAHAAEIAKEEASLRIIDPSTLSDERILATITDWQRSGPDTLQVVLLLSGVTAFEELLRKACESVGAPFERLLYAHLATGERSTSAQQAVDLVAVANVARTEPRAREWLMGADASIDGMRAALRGTAFISAFDRFLERYGHRGLYETDWASPRYTENPAPLLSAIRLHLLGEPGDDRSAVDARAAVEATDAWAGFDRRVTGARRLVLLPQARWLLARIKRYYIWRERTRSDMIRVAAVLRGWHLTLARRFVERGWLDRPEDYFLLRFGEITSAVTRDRGSRRPPSPEPGLRTIAAARAAELERYRRIDMPLLMRESELPRLIREARLADDEDDATELRGDPVSRGVVEGEVVVILDPGDFSQMKRGAILVTRATDPSWTPLFTLASGVVVEVGGVLSHASTVAREYGIPALANVRNATKRLRTGDRVELNATGGFVRKV